MQAFGDDVQLYLDGGPTQGHVASTVVAADPHERDGIVILREGVIPQPVVRKAAAPAPAATPDAGSSLAATLAAWDDED